MKRFYDEVSVGEAPGGFRVMLNERAVKTVGGAAQIVPSRALADQLAGEWAAQGERIDPQSFIWRDMADYAIDVVASDPESVASKLRSYGETDTLCYRADPEDALFARQIEVWEPLIADAEKRFDVSFTRTSGIVHKPQPDATLHRLQARLLENDPFTLAGIETLTTLSASLICGLLASAPDGDAEAIWQAASLEEEWQAELWGRDDEAEDRRQRRERDYLRAVQFIRLTRHP